MVARTIRRIFGDPVPGYEQAGIVETKFDRFFDGTLSVLGGVAKLGATFLLGGVLVSGIWDETHPKYTTIEGTVFDSHYTNPTAKNFWGDFEESKYSFSIDSGKTTIRVKKTSGCALEDVASSLKQGTGIRLYVPRKDIYSSQHTVPSNRIRVK